MNPNSILSQNEFMPAQQPTNDPMFDNFMQACLNNPTFFESMKQFYNQANQPRGMTISNRQLQQNPSSSLPASQPPHKRQQSQENYDEQNELESTSQKEFKRDNKRLPANPLLKYQPQGQASTAENSNANSRRAVPQEPKSVFEQQPIKSRYTENIGNSTVTKASFDLNAIKENQSINIEFQERPNKVPVKPTKEVARNFDEQPIRGMNTEQIERVYQGDERPIKRMEGSDLEYYHEIPTTNKINNNSKNSTVSKALDDDRPLTGAKKDFKQLLKEQFPESFLGEEAEAEEPQERKVEPRNFLKRGSRQHLSSAMNRSKQPKKKEEDLDRSGLDRSRDLTPKSQKRSVSQNRILGKKARQNNINDKSINKPIPKNQDPPQTDQPRIPKPKPPMANPTSRKTEPMIPPKSSAKVEPAQHNKKKKKNVFDDNSSSFSSEEEPFFKAPTKPAVVAELDDRIEVIQGVFLSEQQLQEILERHGRAHPQKETQSEKIQAIRNKYTELCQLVEAERQANAAELQKEKEDFEKYKADQLNKIKNERRVMERQLKSGPTQSLQKEREELQALKAELEKEREDFKKKDKNNRIIIDKYRKENEELKARLDRMEVDKESVAASKKSLNTYKSEEQPEEREKPANRQSTRPPKKEEEEISYKDIKKGKGEIKEETKKIRYDYAEEEPSTTSQVTNLQKETRIENKWVSRKHSDSDSDPSSDQEQEGGQEESGPQWSPAMKLSDLTKQPISIKMVTEPMINALFKYQTNIEYRRYQQALKSPTRTVVNSTRNTKNNFLMNLYSDRSKEHIYDNGTRKETLQNGYTIVYFRNGDIKQTLPDQTILYYFKEKGVDQITLSNGLNIYRFDNNQVEFHYPNGTVEIRHPDGTIRVMGEVTRR